MTTFTFIFEYKGGTYIEQVPATGLKEAIDIWGDLVGPEIPKFGKKKKRQLIKEIQLDEPSLLTGLINVWCLSLRVGKSLSYINIVATFTSNLIEV
jgi:hypothetical protein